MPHVNETDNGSDVTNPFDLETNLFNVKDYASDVTNPFDVESKPAAEPNSTQNSKLSKFHKKKGNRHRHTCFAWMLSSSSTNHACRDRQSFNKYIPFDSHIQDPNSRGKGHSVAGVGDVKLTLLRTFSSHQTNIVTLEHVLHVPTIACNVFAVNIEGLSYNLAGKGQIWDGRANENWGYTTTEPYRLPLLALAGEMKGAGDLVEGEEHWIRCVWPAKQMGDYGRYLEQKNAGFKRHMERLSDDMRNIQVEDREADKIVSSAQLAESARNLVL